MTHDDYLRLTRRTDHLEILIRATMTPEQMLEANRQIELYDRHAIDRARAFAHDLDRARFEQDAAQENTR